MAATQDPYGYAANNPVNMVDPLGLAPWDALPGIDDIKDAAGDAWDKTGGKAVSATADVGEAAWRNREKIATGLAIGTCVAASLGVCAAATGGAFFVRSQMSIQKNGWEQARRGILIDGTITATTFGLVSVPASYGFHWAHGAHLATSARGLFYGAPLWQSALSRGLVATPDIFGLAGSFRDDC